jgi:hypothetical protein
VLETHIGVEARSGADRAAAFGDTVGVAAIELIFIPVPPVVATSTSRPIRSRFRSEHCCHDD